MTDSLELESMSARTNVRKERVYQKVEYLQVKDEQGGIYDQGQVSYTTAGLLGKSFVYSDSYFALPLTIALASDARIAVKNSLLSLIQGVTIKSSGGTTVVSELMSTPIVNNLKLLLDSNLDFCQANELMFFGHDKNIRNDVAKDAHSVVGGVHSSVTSKLPTIDPLHNPALASRISVFETGANPFAINGGGPDGTRQLLARIPLKFLSDFFMQLDMPIQNLSLDISFNIAGVGSFTSYKPFTCPSFAAHRTLGDPDAATAPQGSLPATNSAADVQTAITASLAFTEAAAIAAVAAPTITIPATMTDIRGFVCKPSLWLKQVYFNAEDALEVAKDITAGYQIVRAFSTSNYYPSVQTAAAFSQPIAQNIVRPTRVWAFPLTTGTLASVSNSFPASIGPNYITNLQLKVSGDNIYKQPQTDQYAMYKEFKTQCIGAGASSYCATPINYSDWLWGMNPYCMDISRNPTVKSNNGVTLDLEGTVKVAATQADIATNYDLCVVVERMRTVVIDISAGGVSMDVKDGSD